MNRFKNAVMLCLGLSLAVSPMVAQADTSTPTATLTPAPASPVTTIQPSFTLSSIQSQSFVNYLSPSVFAGVLSPVAVSASDGTGLYFRTGPYFSSMGIGSDVESMGQRMLFPNDIDILLWPELMIAIKPSEVTLYVPFSYGFSSLENLTTSNKFTNDELQVGVGLNFNFDNVFLLGGEFKYFQNGLTMGMQQFKDAFSVDNTEGSTWTIIGEFQLGQNAVATQSQYLKLEVHLFESGAILNALNNPAAVNLSYVSGFDFGAGGGASPTPTPTPTATGGETSTASSGGLAPTPTPQALHRWGLMPGFY